MPRVERPRQRFRGDHRPIAPDEGKTLPELVTDFIDMLRSRPRDIAQLTREGRIELSREFAAALLIVPPAQQHSDITSTAAMCAEAGDRARS